MKKEEKCGWVYFIKCGRYYKVGITKNNIKSRMINYKTHNPNPIFMKELVYVYNYQVLESNLFEKYFHKKNKNVLSDWYILDKEAAEDVIKDMRSYQQDFFSIPDYKVQLTNLSY